MSDYTSKREPWRAGDHVWTPLRRRAILKHYRQDGKWDACYASEHGGMTGDKVVLAPEHLIPVKE